ncbi:acyltransferase family protein [Thermoflavifilum thermophilum]|uniref:Fucose 4-O-acetylase n=1 Tax=Thermoflavifilum thermophilum TaxID=1393122 RepID=A0A1I7NE72_9BACT|nr:acyltransferase [Thermoflavifilum thermophilum]SFV32964.1 Fucose 4-O-acetylase [Thermoflavifilum thermophilum]
MKLKIKYWIEYFFNISHATQSRLSWVDYAKGIALILVAYRHILIGFERAGLPIHIILLKANEMFFSFRMPLFFILSGIFISKSLEKRGWLNLIKVKSQTLLYPYILWCTIQITLQILFSKYTNSDRTLHDFTYIITNPDALDQMWYLFALFNVSVLYIILKYLLKIPALIQLGVGIIFYYLSTKYNSGPIRDLLYFYPFFALGDLVSSYLLNKKFYPIYRSHGLFFGILPAFIISQWYFLQHENIEYTHIFQFAGVALIGCAFMLNICFILGKYDKLNFLKIVGYHSLYIYILHVGIASLFRVLFTHGLEIRNTNLLLPINLILSITLSIMLYNLIIRNGGWFIFILDKKRINNSINQEKQPIKLENANKVTFSLYN